MKLTLSIKKGKKGWVWGSVFIMHNLIIENGRSKKEVKQKLLAQLQHFYELNPTTLQLQEETPHRSKARQLVNRLRKNGCPPPVSFSFNSAYFT